MNINLIAPINTLGYGYSGLNIALSLNKAGNNVALFPIGQSDVPEEHEGVIAEMKANTSEYDPNAPCLRIWHQDQMAEFVGRDKRIGFPFFELDTFNAREKHHLGNLDDIYVASKWAKKVVLANIDINESHVKVVPLGVDRTIFNEGVRGETLNPDYTVFLNVGKWERRKGHDILLSAFNKAFRPSDKVLLKMVSYNPFIGAGNDGWARHYLTSPMGRNIMLVPRLTNQRSLATLMASADCGVFPARAEGWNLDLLEMMSMGKNVICTYNTGHTQFVNPANARLIKCDQLELAEDGVWFHGQGNWHYLGDEQEEHLIYELREIHRLKQTGQLVVNTAGIETAKLFSWENTANQIIKGLEN